MSAGDEDWSRGGTEIKLWPHGVFGLGFLITGATLVHQLAGIASPIFSTLLATANLLAAVAMVLVAVLWWHYRTKGLAWLGVYSVILPLLDSGRYVLMDAWIGRMQRGEVQLPETIDLGELVLTLEYGWTALTYIAFLLAFYYLAQEIRRGVYTPDGSEVAAAGEEGAG